MSNGQSAFAEPMTMQEALAKFDSQLVTKESEAREAAQEPQDDEMEADEVEVEASDEVEDLDTDDTDEPDDGGEGSDQILTVDEYGDVLVDLNGEPTPLKEVIQGTLRQADYTRKTQALKDEQKAIQAELERKQQELDAREQQLARMAQELEEPEPDWEKLADEDPLGWASAKAKWESKQKAKAQRQRDMQKRMEQQRASFAKKTAEMAVNLYPEWSDPKKFDEGAEARRKAALAAGFTEEEYNSTPDFRIAVLLDKAAKWDAMQADTSQKRVAAEKKIAKTPKVLKPGQSRGDSDPKQERRAAFQKRLSKPISSAELTRALGLR